MAARCGRAVVAVAVVIAIMDMRTSCCCCCCCCRRRGYRHVQGASAPGCWWRRQPRARATHLCRGERRRCSCVRRLRRAVLHAGLVPVSRGALSSAHNGVRGTYVSKVSRGATRIAGGKHGRRGRSTRAVHPPKLGAPLILLSHARVCSEHRRASSHPVPAMCVRVRDGRGEHSGHRSHPSVRTLTGPGSPVYRHHRRRRARVSMRESCT
jgi:hypothetical protein